MHTTGRPYKLSVAQKQNRLGLTWFLGTSNGKLETKLGTNGRYCFLLNRRLLFAQHDTEKWKKSWSQYISNNNNLHEHNVGVSYA